MHNLEKDNYARHKQDYNSRALLAASIGFNMYYTP